MEGSSLEEVAGQDELDAPEGLLAAPEVARHLLQRIEQLRRDHGDLVQDQHLPGAASSCDAMSTHVTQSILQGAR